MLIAFLSRLIGREKREEQEAAASPTLPWSRRSQVLNLICRMYLGQYRHECEIKRMSTSTPFRERAGSVSAAGREVFSQSASFLSLSLLWPGGKNITAAAAADTIQSQFLSKGLLFVRNDGSDSIKPRCAHQRHEFVTATYFYNVFLQVRRLMCSLLLNLARHEAWYCCTVA